MDDELLDLVDRNDQVIGTINRKDYQRLLDEDLGYIRAAQLFVVNSQGKLYIPIRTAEKTIAPNGFDYSAGGHVGAGDDYAQAMVREAEEELYLENTADDLEFVAKLFEEKIRYFNAVYVLRSSDTPKLNPRDFVSAEWLEPDEVIAKIDAGHPAKDSLRQAVVLVQDYLKETAS